MACWAAESKLAVKSVTHNLILRWGMRSIVSDELVVMGGWRTRRDETD